MKTNLNALGSRPAMRLALTLAVALSLASTGCLENNRSVASKAASATTNSTATGVGNVAVKTDTMKISNVTVNAPATGVPTASVFFDTVVSETSISTHCRPASSSTGSGKPCACQFNWSQINATSGTSVAVPRMVQTTVTVVNSGKVECSVPSVYSSEIPNGTQIQVTVLAGPGNGDLFTMTAYRYTKAGATSGSFQDAQGRFFDNVLRYSCYEEFKRGTSVRSKMASVTNSTATETVSFPIASQFCVAKGSGTPDGCPAATAIGNSSHSYYYNLYVRDSERGDINRGNGRYTCPLVNEALVTNGNAGTGAQAWPLDATFALSLGANTDFPIGVEAFSKTSNGSDPTSQGSSCFSSGTSGGGSGSGDTLVKSCLGFAAKPNPDGSCPYFRDSNNAIRLTYRLRRFVALLPPQFQADGSPVTGQGQSVDTIYVVDRPVSSSLADPLKPFTMLGPKPCPYSWFDSTGVSGTSDLDNAGATAHANGTYPDSVRPDYAATNNSALDGKNIDGLQFPYQDTATSCSAALPILNSDKSVMSLATVNAANPVSALKRVYVRGMKAWSPHYEEDTSFQGCAPLAAPFRDPPLHFARASTGNIAYCAEAYPSQNDSAGALDYRPSAAAAHLGRVRPFTSHIVKNSASAACAPSAVTLPALYPAVSAATCPAASTVAVGAADPTWDQSAMPPEGYARHPAGLIEDITKSSNSVTKTHTPLCSTRTCDRTVAPGSTTWNKFPLLSRGVYVENAMKADASFSCTVTYDNGNGKTDTRTPTQGCCGANVSMITGIAAAASGVTLTNENAHLEPDAACLTPQY